MMKARSNSPVEELIQLLIEKNILRGVALEANKITKANRLFDQIAEISRNLLQVGDSANASILALLDHDDPYVRTWAAFLCLEFDPNKAEPVLQQLVTDYAYKGFVDPKILHISHSAKMTLKVWREGKLIPISDWSQQK